MNNDIGVNKFPIKDDDRITVHIHGACSGNPGVGGWGVAAANPTGQIIEQFGSVEHTTNMRMELQAAIEACKMIRQYVMGKRCLTVIYSDNKPLVDGINDWVEGWELNGWRNSAKKPVENQDLWKELRALDRVVRPDWRWKKGSTESPLKERCDELARAATRIRKAASF